MSHLCLLTDAHSSQTPPLTETERSGPMILHDQTAKRWSLGSRERLTWIVENLYLNQAEKRIYSFKFSNINYSKKMKSEAFKPV